MGRDYCFCNVVTMSHPNVPTTDHLVQHMKRDAGMVYLINLSSENDCEGESRKRKKSGDTVEGSGKEESTLTTQNRTPWYGGALLEQLCYPEGPSQQADALGKVKQKSRVKGLPTLYLQPLSGLLFESVTCNCSPQESCWARKV